MAQESPKNTLDEIQKHLPFLPGWVLTALLVLALLGGLLALLRPWMPLVHTVRRSLTWLFRSRTDKRRVDRLAMFADHVENQMRWLGQKEEWREGHYAELEADLEIIGERGSALRRVPSLSAALERSTDRITLLEGEPGSGKSLALRHLAQRMAHAATKDPTTIPIYVNLKTFVPANIDPGADDVREFILHTINQIRDRRVEQFLDEEFEHGLEAGIWLFLFDSFDEIPAILSATEADAVIIAYADALHGFLHSMKRCRGVVASREFRGPGRRAWPTFRVVPLSRKRKIDLIKRGNLPAKIEQSLLVDLPTAGSSVQQMSDNPLFLSLLCQHMKEKEAFPADVHVLLETYVGHRLAHGTGSAFESLGTTLEFVRDVAEELAFVMTESLGLAVDKAKAVDLVATGLRRTKEEVGKALDGLQYTKLMRTGDNDDSSITFSHRRIQEYFATCTVIRDSERIPARPLLVDGRWRETAVTVLQTQEVSTLPTEADSLLPEVEADFTWQPGTLHLLGLLAESGRPAALAGTGIPRKAGAILRQAWEHGKRHDRKWALESCSVADRETCLHLVRSGFASDSEWLRQESYTQVRKVPDIADDVAQEVCQALVDMTVGGRLRKERKSVLSQISRLPNPARFLPTYWLLLVTPLVNLVLFSLVVLDVSWLVFVADGETGEVLARSAFAAALAVPYNLVRVGRLSPPALRRQFPFVRSWLPDAPRRVGILFPLLAWLTIAILFLACVLSAQPVWVVCLVVFVWISSGALSVVGEVFDESPTRVALLIVSSLFRGVRSGLRGFWPAAAFVVACLALGVWFVAKSSITGNVLIWLGGALLVYLLLPVVGTLPLFVGWILDRHRVGKMLKRRLDVPIDEFSDFLYGIRTVGGALFFFTEARKRELTWTADQAAALADLAATMEKASGRKPRWLRDSDVLDTLSMLLGDIVKPSSTAARADHG